MVGFPLFLSNANLKGYEFPRHSDDSRNPHMDSCCKLVEPQPFGFVPGVQTCLRALRLVKP